MPRAIVYRLGDQRPSWSEVLRDEAGQPVDLTLATSVMLHVRDKATGLTSINEALTVALPKTLGLVVFGPVSGDVGAVEEGEGEIVVTWNDGTEQTWPRRGTYPFFVIQDVTPPVPVDHVAITPSVVAGFPTQTLQLTATPYDVSGNALVGRVISWTSSDNTHATVTSAGLVQFQAVGTANITATVEGKTAMVVANSQQAQDGSVADLQYYIGNSRIIALGSPTDSAPVLDVNGRVRYFNDPRGLSYPVFKSGLELGLTGSTWNPYWDPVTGIIRTNTPGPSGIWLDASALHNIHSNSRALVVLGAFNVSAGTKAAGWYASDWTDEAAIQGDFSGNMSLNLPYGVSYLIDSGRAIPGTTLGIWIMDHVLPIGNVLGISGGGTMGLPNISVEGMGLLRRILTSKPDFLNAYTLPKDINYRAFVGAESYGTGTNAADASIKAIIEIVGPVTYTDRAALKRFAQRLGITVTAPKSRGVICLGDSRTWGNGSTSMSTAFPARLLSHLGGSSSNYDVVNRGILGRWNRELNYMRTQLAIDDLTDLRSGTAVVLFAGINDYQGGYSLANIGNDQVACATALTAAGLRVYLTGDIAPMTNGDIATLNATLDACVAAGNARRNSKFGLLTHFTYPAVNAPTGVYTDGLHFNDTGADELGTAEATSISGDWA